jgi:hypothetical protein
MNCSNGVCYLDKKTEVMDQDKKLDQQLKLLKEFQNQLLSFIDELIEQFPNVGEFVIGRIFIKDQIPASDLLGRFIRDLLPYKDQVDQRDDAFFINNSLLYTKGQVSNDRVDRFKELWLSTQLDKEDRDVIWKWMDVFMSVASKYHKTFGPVEGW